MTVVKKMYPDICTNCGGTGNVLTGIGNLTTGTTDICPVCGGSGTVMVTEERIVDLQRNDEIQCYSGKTISVKGVISGKDILSVLQR